LSINQIGKNDNTSPIIGQSDISLNRTLLL